MRYIQMFLSAAVLLLWGCSEAPASGLVCGTGTRSSNGQCVPELGSLCGSGTTARDGRCVAQAQVTCGQGTVLQGAACVSSITCGTGTVQQGSECVPSSTLSCGAGTVQQGSECVPSSTLSCGAGTVQQGSECVPSSTLSCGPGTVQQGSECVPSSTLSCGTGTTQVGNTCRADLSKVCGTDTAGSSDGTTCYSVMSCGSGTYRDGNVCRPGPGACGSGTTFSGSGCEVNPNSVCGAGTVWENGQCVKPVPSPSLEAFSSNAMLKSGFYRDTFISGTSTVYEYRAAVTDLSQGSAEGWAHSESTLVGDGAAVHMKFWGPSSIGAGTPFVAQIANARSGGVCQSSLSPTSKPSPFGTTYANFFAWNSAVSSMRVCAIGGSVKVERLTLGGQDSARLTFNIQFSDGTAWTDKVFEMPWYQKG